METERTLGYKTFRFSLLRNCIGGVLLLLISLALLGGRSFLKATLLTGDGGNLINPLTNILFIASIAILLAIVVATWIVYTTTTFHLDDYALKLKTGFINKREILIPYRQVQDVNINRPLLYRIFGVSSLVILTAGHEDEHDEEDQRSEGAFSLIDADLAAELQAELMKRASVQMVSSIADHPQAPLSI